MSRRRRRSAAKRHPRGAGRAAARAARGGADRATATGTATATTAARPRRAGRGAAGAGAADRRRAPAVGLAAAEATAPAAVERAAAPSRRRSDDGRAGRPAQRRRPGRLRPLARAPARGPPRPDGDPVRAAAVPARGDGARGCAHAARGAVMRIEKGAVTERHVREAAEAGARLVLAPRAVLTPMARDRRAQPGSRDREGAAMLRATVTGSVWATRRIDKIPERRLSRGRGGRRRAAGRLRRPGQRHRRARARRHRVGRRGLVRRRATRRSTH